MRMQTTQFSNIVLIAAVVTTVGTLGPRVDAQMSEGKVYSVTDRGVTPPRPLKRVDPQYDESARAERIEGTVKLKVVISREGIPVRFEVLESLDPRLDPKAIAAARQWRFEPARLEGKPVAFQVALHLQFRLRHPTPSDN